MKVLVTGAGGFIGSHLTELLVREGYDVRAMVIYDSLGSRGWLDSVAADVQSAIEVTAGDVRDANFVRVSLKNCEGVLNLAALIAIPYSYVAPESYVQTNIIGTLNVVQAAHDLGIKKVVHASTSEVYGTAQFAPITEEHPLVGQSPYAASKIGADQIALSFWRSFGTPVAVARPFNTYGPRQSTRAVIPTIVTQIAAGQRKISLGALHPTRDFNFVEDTARGLLAVLRSESSVGEVINIGSGFEISVGDTAKLVAEVMGVSIEIEEADQRKRPPLSEVERLLACTKKAERILGWSATHAGRAGLREGLRKTADWFSKPANLALYRIGTYTI
jgi:NAD dependent epimerase/dehydratase